MAVTDQTFSVYANNDVTLRWDGILDLETGGGALLNLTGKVVKFALARFANGEPIRANPELDFSSADASPRVTIPNPVTGDPHVLVSIRAEDTAELAPTTTDYYVELEVFEADGSVPVVVATGTLTLKPNVDNE